MPAVPSLAFNRTQVFQTKRHCFKKRTWSDLQGQHKHEVLLSYKEVDTFNVSESSDEFISHILALPPPPMDFHYGDLDYRIRLHLRTEYILSVESI